jgi:hypothetical protein
MLLAEHGTAVVRYNFLHPAVSFSAHCVRFDSFKVGANVTSG